MPAVIAKVYAALPPRSIRRTCGLLVVLLIGCFFIATAQTGTVLGDWQEPGGSVIRIARCGQELCAFLQHISAQAASTVDRNNPDPARRAQPLCGLRIGYGFHLKDPAHADDGWLYDPKSGKIYHGTMTDEGDTLFLRGYVGAKIFGRTERWTRVRGPAPSCT